MTYVTHLTYALSLPVEQTHKFISVHLPIPPSSKPHTFRFPSLFGCHLPW